MEAAGAKEFMLYVVTQVLLSGSLDSKIRYLEAALSLSVTIAHVNVLSIL